MYVHNQVEVHRVRVVVVQRLVLIVHKHRQINGFRIVIIDEICHPGIGNGPGDGHHFFHRNPPILEHVLDSNVLFCHLTGNVNLGKEHGALLALDGLEADQVLGAQVYVNLHRGVL